VSSGVTVDNDVPKAPASSCNGALTANVTDDIEQEAAARMDGAGVKQKANVQEKCDQNGVSDQRATLGDSGETGTEVPESHVGEPTKLNLKGSRMLKTLAKELGTETDGFFIELLSNLEQELLGGVQEGRYVPRVANLEKQFKTLMVSLKQMGKMIDIEVDGSFIDVLSRLEQNMLRETQTGACLARVTKLEAEYNGLMDYLTAKLNRMGGTLNIGMNGSFADLLSRIEDELLLQGWNGTYLIRVDNLEKEYHILLHKLERLEEYLDVESTCC
jgi:hypothetical protein